MSREKESQYVELLQNGLLADTQGVGRSFKGQPILTHIGRFKLIGIFSTLIGALLLSKYVPGIDFDLLDAASIGIIGGADGPTAIYLSSKLSPHLLGSATAAGVLLGLKHLLS